MRPAYKIVLTDERLRATVGEARVQGSRPGEVWTVDEASRQSFDKAVLVHERQLYARALCFCRNPDEARDLVQDTLVRALRHFEGLRPGSNVRGWLMVILVNLYRDGLKRRRSAREVALEPWHDTPDEPPAAPSHPTLEPEQVGGAIAKLPEDLRRLFEMQAIEGLRYREIGARLSIPTNTVGTRLRRARKILCQLLGFGTADADGDGDHESEQTHDRG